MNGGWTKLALKVASRSPHPHHKMGAVIVSGGRVLSAACNLHTWHGHAETRALGMAGDVKGGTLYIVRTNLKISKPCANCHEAIAKAGLRWVVYFNKEDNQVVEDMSTGAIYYCDAIKAGKSTTRIVSL